MLERSKETEEEEKLDKTQLLLLLSLPSLRKAKNQEKERKMSGEGAAEVASQKVKSYSSRVSRSFNHLTPKNDHFPHQLTRRINQENGHNNQNMNSDCWSPQNCTVLVLFTMP